MPSTPARRRAAFLVALLLPLLVLAAPGGRTFAEDPPAQPPSGEDPGALPEGPPAGSSDDGMTKSLDARIGEAVRKGVAWLKGAQLTDGSWGLIEGNRLYDPKGDPNAVYKHPAGSTGLSLYALLKCGVPLDDPVVKKGFKFLKDKHKSPGSSYEVAAVLLAVTATADPFKATKDSVAAGEKVKLTGEWRTWAQSLTTLLVGKREKFKTLGWRYNFSDAPSPGGDQDLSSTQFATLALLAAERCGIKTDSRVWNEVLTFALRQQEKEGPEHPRAVQGKAAAAKGRDSRYAPSGGEGPKDRARGFAYILSDTLNPDEGKPTGGMTACGIGTLQMARYILAMRGDKTYLGRDLRGLQQSIYDGLAWLDLNWSAFNNPRKQSENVYHIYYLYCVERAFDLLGFNRLGSHTWYPEMAEELLRVQAGDGSWNSKSTHKPEAVLDTAFALLFLRRATKGGIPFASLTEPGDQPPADARGN